MKRLGIALAFGGLLALPMAALGQGHHGQEGTRPMAGQAGTAMRGGMMSMHSGMMGGMMGMRGGSMMGSGMMGGMMGSGMMGAMSAGMGPAAAMILGQKELLGLSSDQVSRLQAIQKRMREARDAHARSVGPLHQELRELAAAEKPDLSRYESLLRKAADSEVQTRVELARLGQDALAVLEPAQRSKLQAGMGWMRGMRKSMMRGGSMNGGVMQSGAGATAPCSRTGAGGEKD
ncbi:MAG: Spy/CpxP family protein refolding chaperone [Gemmatimonadota bacterium]